MAIASGIANVGVVWRSRKRGDPSSRMWSHTNEQIFDHWKWSRPSGLVRPVDESSMLMRRYMYQYNYDRKDLASVSIALRKYANCNERALMHHKSLTLEDYMNCLLYTSPSPRD